MDGFKGKRTTVPVLSGKAGGVALHENMKKKDDKLVPVCSRVGCSSRVSSTKGASIDHKAKSSFRSFPSQKETSGSSSRSMSGFGSTKKTSKVTGRSLLDTDSSEGSSSVHDDESHVLPRGKTKEKSVVSVEVVKEAGSSSKSIHQRPDLVARDARIGNKRDSSSKSGSNVPPSNSNSTKKSNVFRKKTADGESSASSSNRGNRSVNQSSPQGDGIITMSESRRNRNLPSVRDNSVGSSSTSRRTSGYFGRTGRSGAVATLQPPPPRPATRADLNSSRSAEVSRSPSNSSNGRLHSRMMPSSPSETALMNRDGLRRYNMNGVAEVLLALERMGQDEELTYEQLVVLETNLFLNGLTSIHDQHRDMRLDIDNMSYEELLALEEKMGTVSTALSEEALLKSLKSSIYNPTGDNDIVLNKDDDVKCSICQEEYVDGDEIGTLACKHMYHMSCAQQWLRMKNWCPICKSSAESQPQPFS